MSGTDTIEMIHEDKPPGRESAREPGPEWAVLHPNGGTVVGS